MQVDVKFLDFRVEEGKKIRRFHYTAIDDATRIRALKIYERHTPQNSIETGRHRCKTCLYQTQDAATK